jgi:hypothetical protein
MDKDVAEKLQLIDAEISNALETISQLEEKLTTVRTDDEGNILKDECEILKDKFASFNRTFHKLTRKLVESGILKEEDVEM